MRRLILPLCAALSACASQGAPPGGPPDIDAPKIVTITPDSGKTGVKGGSAIFRFDEVVAERPASVTNLGDLFVISPRRGAPNVSWHREEIRVKPRAGWLPNTTYTVTMLPGLADLRGNVKNTGASTFFSTGGAIDGGALTGRVFDLVSGAAVKGATVEARVAPDTTVSWLATADTIGAFRLAHLPARRFSMRAYLDRNHNFGIDPDEAWDSASVSVIDSASAQFFVIVRDSIPPQIARAEASDSVTIVVTFDRPADSASAVALSNYLVNAADSSAVPLLGVKATAHDTIPKRPVRARATPLGSVVITLGQPLAPKKSYRIRATGIRGVLGQTLPSEAPVITATPRAAPTTAPAPTKRPPNVKLPGGAVPIPIKR